MKLAEGAGKARKRPDFIGQNARVWFGYAELESDKVKRRECQGRLVS